ncbi:MAG: hypothetical protein E6X23_20430 [Mixta calida]|uniref:hypothetical protein n=1 Tax=Mixta calida TaxID=665913 RepID=UPI0029110E79|nr:hypothetical protein [Mixta calida]MDU4943872.1 hypothetical protein [Mixta calida]
MTLIYVTKYALTSGIFAVEADVEESRKIASYKQPASYFVEYVHGNDFHLTQEAAVARAEEMRIKKLQSLDKKIKQISAMKFEIKE